MHTLKRRRVLTSSELQAKEFTQVSFAYSEEKLHNYLLTLSGEPDYRVIIWLWDKSRFVASIGFKQEALLGQVPNMASFNPYMTSKLQRWSKHTSHEDPSLTPPMSAVELHTSP